MSKKMLGIILVLVAGLAAGNAWAALEVYLPFDEGAGDVTADLSGNGRDGTLEGGPAWVAGVFGSALDFDGTNDYVNVTDYKGIVVEGGTQQPFSITNWVKTTVSSGDTEMVTWGNNSGGQRLTWRVHEGRLRTEHGSGNLRGNTYVNDDEWYHVALTVEEGANLRPAVTKLYVNGVEETYRNGSDNGYNLQPNADVSVGRRADNGSRYFPGTLDDVAIYSHVLTPEEIQDTMANTANPFKAKASRPGPKDGVTDLPYYTNTLTWGAGDYAVTHDVYFGANFDDVNDASIDDDRGVLVSQGQTETSYTITQALDLETTYYWRIDEVNAPSKPATFKGDTWNFTIEPVAYPLTNVTATASGQLNDDTGPEKVVDGSGLLDGLHDANDKNMWLAPVGLPAWVQFDFGQVYILNDMKIWNQNQLLEMILGFGAKDVVIETSEDGETFTPLGDPIVLNRAPGADGAPAGNTIDMSGVRAKAVKITINTSYGFLMQSGLAEVRFSYIPAYPREFAPKGGTDTDGLAVDLSWRAGRFAMEHKILHSTDRAAVADGSAVVDTITDKSYSLSGLEFGQLNYWQVIDVAADGTMYPSDIMYFYTAQTGVIDDMEMYKDEEFLEIWSYWADGYNDASNGSTVGNGSAPETVEVYEGSQSMPMAYDNSTAPISEATRSFDPPLDLAAGNADNIGLYFKGVPYEFNGYYSQDGPDFWTAMTLNPLAVAMGDEATIGLAFTSHDRTAMGTGTFSEIVTSGGVSGDWTVEAFGSVDAGHPADIGGVTGSTATLNAAGNDIWNQADEFVYAYKQLSGEGSIQAKVDSLVDPHAWTKAGVMIRNAADASASYASVQVTGTNGIRFQYRDADGVSAESDSSVLDGTQELLSEPAWIKVERKSVNSPAKVYLKFMDSANKSFTVEHSDPEATRLGDWTLLSVALSDITGVNLASIKSISVGVDGPGAVGRLYVDYLRQTRPLAIAPLEEVSDEGLIAHYEFEDGGADSTGNYPGELFGNATLIPDGKIGQALGLGVAPDANGVDVGSWMAIGLNYQHNAWPEFTVAAWARTESETGQLIVSMDRDEYYRLEIAGSGGGPGQVGFCVQTDAGQLDYGSITRVDDGEWHHLAGVFDKGTARIFIDGRPEPAASNGTGFGRGNLRYGLIGANSEAMEFNGTQNATPAYFLGDIDDVRIYHRALLPGEVASLALE